MVRTRRAASAGAARTHELNAKARTRKETLEVVCGSWRLSAERSGARTDGYVERSEPELSVGRRGPVRAGPRRIWCLCARLVGIGRRAPAAGRTTQRMVTERMNGTERTADDEPTPDERLPPRETRTELRRTTARPPPLHRQTNALEIERSNPTLELLPTNADRHLPTPSGPTDLKMLSHTFLLREHLQVGRDAGSTGRVGEPTTPDSPKESIN